MLFIIIYNVIICYVLEIILFVIRKLICVHIFQKDSLGLCRSRILDDVYEKENYQRGMARNAEKKCKKC